MYSSATPSTSSHRHAHDFGAPTLLLVSLAAVAFMVLVIVLVGVTNASWAIATAMLAHGLATAVVTAAVMKMLADRADP